MADRIYDWKWEDGRLDQEIYYPPQPGTPQVVTTFNWDPSNKNKLRSITRDGQVICEFDYYVSGNLKFVKRGTDMTTLTESQWPNGTVTVEHDVSLPRTYKFVGGELKAISMGSSVYVIKEDQLEQRLFENSVFLEKYVYNHMGELTVLSPAGAVMNRTPLSDYLFLGQFYEPTSGMYFLANGVWYHPKIGMTLLGKYPPWHEKITGKPFPGKPIPTTPVPPLSKNPRMKRIVGTFGDAYELQYESTMICHGVDRFRNVMVGAPNSFANLPGGLKPYVEIRDTTVRTFIEVSAAMLIPGGIAVGGARSFIANSTLQSAKFAAVHEGFGAVVLDEEISPKRFATNTALGVFFHGSLVGAGKGLQAAVQSKLARELTLIAALKNPFAHIPPSRAMYPGFPRITQSPLGAKVSLPVTGSVSALEKYIASLKAARANMKRTNSNPDDWIDTRKWRFQLRENPNYRADLAAEVPMPDTIKLYDADHLVARSGARAAGELEFVPLGWMERVTNQRTLGGMFVKGGQHHPDRLVSREVRAAMEIHPIHRQRVLDALDDNLAAHLKEYFRQYPNLNPLK